MTGRAISHYEVLEKLGEGGMGVVYRARDTHLDRLVAIKILPGEKVADPERKRRFVQEAKAASALNHPNIITVHDVAQDAGMYFIVMEFVPGKTLDQLIGRKGLKLNEALKYGVQIADALSRAHTAGIIHRDLKPGNIMVDEHGLVKVLDFGLAKLTETAPAGQDERTRTMRPTTEEGTILGTVAYMSPEQAEGKPVDARSDTFSFGTVLYEMLTGRRAFQKESKASTLGAIIHREPEPLGTDVPRDLEKVISRCLRKDPTRRFQHMADVKVALEELKEDSDLGRLGAQPGGPAKLWRVPWAAVAVVALVVGAGGVGITWWLLRSPASAKPLELTRVTSDAGLTTYPALSRDGKLLAYASDRSGEGNLDIWVQQVGGGAPIRLTRHEADDREPSFSPDGTKIVFRSEREGGGIYVIPTLGGEEQRIAEKGRSPRFSPDGRWITYWVGDLSAFGRNRIYVVSLDGGQPRQLQPEFDTAYLPLWSPDGKHLLYAGVERPQGPTLGVHDWWVAPVQGGRAIPTGALAQLQKYGVFPHQRDAGVWLGNRLVFSATGKGEDASRVAIYSASLWQIRLSPKTWQMQGSPQQLTSGTGVEAEPSVAALSDSGQLLALSVTSSNADIWGLPVDANQGKVLGEMRRLVSNAAPDTYPAVSADGTKLAFTSRRTNTWEIWFKDLQSGREVALTSAPSDKFGPVFNPAGSRVAYFDSQFSIFITNSNGGGTQRVCETCGGHLYGWSRDGKMLIYRERKPPEPWYIAVHDLETGQSHPFLKHSSYDVAAPHLSPDQNWAVFQTVVNQTQRQIFVAHLESRSASRESDWIPITDGSGLDRNAVWSPDGNLLYFLSERDGFRCFWAQRLDPRSKRPVGSAFPVQHFHEARRSLMAFNEVVEIGLNVARDKIVFSMPEYTGNIWMARLP
jgi:eukaryotic-like serine/threonine-protein kinase